MDFAMIHSLQQRDILQTTDLSRRQTFRGSRQRTDSPLPLPSYDMIKFFRNIMTSTHVPKRVPIPRNGVDYRNKVVLAPMVRSGELPSRLVALKYGADLVWGPETIDRAMIGASRRINPRNATVEFTRIPSNGGRTEKNSKASVIYRLDPVREKGKLIYQMGTASPDFAVQAAKIVAGDVAGIDVNAGCPKSFSTSGGMGAALLQTPELLAEILETLVRDVGNVWEIGISVKIRLLETPELTEKLVTRLCATGITGLTVHCRTTPMRPRERAIREQLSMITSICRNAGVACLMNGDVTSKDEAISLAKEYGADGGMIATAAETNPSCFRSEAEGGLLPWNDVVHAYIETAMRCENRLGNTKYLLNNHIPGKEAAFQIAKTKHTYEETCLALGYEDLLPAARDADTLLDLTGGPKQTGRKRKQQDLPNPPKDVKILHTSPDPSPLTSEARHIQHPPTHTSQPVSV